MKIPAPPIRMFVALILGLGGGMLLTGPPGQAVLPFVRPVGQLWLAGLTMTVVPLVFGLLVTGILSAARSATAGGLAWRALCWFAVLLLAASILAAIASALALNLWPVAGSDMAPSAPAAAPEAAPAAWYQNIIPANPIKAAADGAMVPIVLFALLFGLAAARIEKRLGDAILTLFDAIVHAMLVLVGWVLWVAPLGIAALAFVAGLQLGPAAIGTFVQYIILVSAACLLATALAYLAAAIAGRLSLARFARAALPAQAVAISTQSSLATLPIMVKAAPALDVAPAAAGLVLPLAVSVFRAASVAANVAVAIYLAHLHGIALSPMTLAAGALIAVPVSLAAVGLPAQVSFFATIAPVCVAMGVPLEFLPLLLAVETIPDIFRTLGNVTADLAVTRIVGKGGQTGKAKPSSAPPRR